MCRYLEQLMVAQLADLILAICAKAAKCQSESNSWAFNQFDRLHKSLLSWDKCAKCVYVCWARLIVQNGTGTAPSSRRLFLLTFSFVAAQAESAQPKNWVQPLITQLQHLPIQWFVRASKQPTPEAPKQATGHKSDSWSRAMHSRVLIGKRSHNPEWGLIAHEIDDNQVGIGAH